MINSSPNILITGASGQLGRALQEHSQHHNIIACSRAELNIADEHSIENAISMHSPDIVINTAAYTAVDKAETDIDAAMLANHVGAKNVALACHHANIPLIHISTDYVFDGETNTPYLESDQTHPINVYGMSKWLGEEAVKEAHDKHIIVRISGVFSEYGNNFLKTMLRLANERKTLKVIVDQFTCPTSAHDIAQALLMMAANPAWGTFHYCSAKPTSWHAFASKIISVAKEKSTLEVEEVIAIPATDYPTPAKRPTYSILDCAKVQNVFGIKQPSWELAIEKIVSNLMIKRFDEV